MKILLAVDGSPCSDAATEEVAHKLLPAGSEIKILSVVEPVVEPMTQPWTVPDNYYQQMEDFAQSRAQQSIIKAEERLKSAETKGLQVTTEIVNGFPKEAIIDEADRWAADLIVVGSHGYRGITRFLIGSVSQAIASHANCSVEIVRCRQAPAVDKKSQE
jgi:nucleotide-binding universal stress UspA family protein